MNLEIVEKQSKQLQEKLKYCIRCHLEEKATNEDIMWLIENFFEVQ